MTIDGSQSVIGGFDLRMIEQTVPTLIIGNSVDILKQFPSNSINMIIDDIGYMDLEKHRAVGTTTRLKASFYETLEYSAILPEYKRLLIDRHHIYFWRPSFSRDSIQYWVELIDPDKGLLAINSFTIRKIIPCLKQYRGMGYSYNSRHERLIECTKCEMDELVFAHVGKSMEQLNDLNTPDVFIDEWKHPHDKTKIHVSEKPTTIYSKLIKASTKFNDIILEPFAGSFQSAKANCQEGLQRRVVGIELDKIIAQRTIEDFKSEGYEINVIEWNKPIQKSY